MSTTGSSHSNHMSVAVHPRNPNEQVEVTIRRTGDMTEFTIVSTNVDIEINSSLDIEYDELKDQIELDLESGKPTKKQPTEVITDTSRHWVMLKWIALKTFIAAILAYLF